VGPAPPAVLEVAGSGDLIRYDGQGTELDAGRVVVDARTLVPSRVLTVPASVIRAAMEQNAAVRACLADLLARRGARMQRALGRALTCRVPDRLLGVLVELCAAHGIQVGGGTLVRLPLTQELLAQMVGATRESVNRALRELARRDRVSMSGRSIVVRAVPSAGMPGSVR
jgi:CRP/FNR family transcriptional regulator